MFRSSNPLPDFEQCLRAAEEGDARFDGWIYVGVTSTGIYCRPSCPARTPKPANMRFYATAAAAQSAGFRACKRCRPDAAPGSPEWDLSADTVGRAMRLIADGVVDREGVTGLADRLGYSERHVHRQLVDAVGAGPLSIARAARAQNARVLLETTTLSAADVASAAGFASVRQFNATIREVFAETPRDLRKRAGASGRRGPARTLELRLPVRQPFNFDQVHGFLARRAIAGVESADAESFTRTLRLPNGHGVVRIAGGDGFVHAEFRLSDLRDLAAATERVRRLCDLDSDPAAADSALSADPELAESVARRPGLRVPGTVDGNELAMRAVLGQQVTVAAATTVAGRLAALCGESIDGDNGPTLLFPTAAVVAELDPKSFAMPQRRAKALVNLARELATGDLQLDGGQDRREVRERLLALPGIGAWTADYIAMRALRDPDAFLPTDIGVRRGLEALGIPIENSERWRPYRAYALQHLWANAAARKD